MNIGDLATCDRCGHEVKWTGHDWRDDGTMCKPFRDAKGQEIKLLGNHMVVRPSCDMPEKPTEEATAIGRYLLDLLTAWHVDTDDVGDPTHLSWKYTVRIRERLHPTRGVSVYRSMKLVGALARAWAGERPDMEEP